MKRLLLIAAAVAALASPASAYDRWNGSGFPLDHHFYSRAPFEGQGNSGQIIRVGEDPTPAEIARARTEAAKCNPVILHTDEGTVVQPTCNHR